ncbi:MAG: Short-chain dehydrogenase/reductase [Betaproteobacteria bacterium]|jgi:short-subunit dehydrogenase|nr:Short-chain dehydrogenase/reductase [Betaproteobacteria bacterium]
MRRVIITGASSGIGTALAREYARGDVVLGLIARRKDALEQLKAQLKVPCEIYPADVRDSAAMRAAAEMFISRHGCPDIVIANAGVSTGTLTEMPEDLAAFQDVLDINVIGMVNTFQPFIAAMRAARHGTLVGIASVAGYRGLPGAAAYSASKAAAISYLESLRVELRASGVKAVTICPGYIATPMTAQNPYPMPFMLSADAAATIMINLIDRGRTYAVMPWQMAIVARVLRVLPNFIYDRLFGNAPRKPRRSSV